MTATCLFWEVAACSSFLKVSGNTENYMLPFSYSLNKLWLSTCQILCWAQRIPPGHIEYEHMFMAVPETPQRLFMRGFFWLHSSTGTDIQGRNGLLMSPLASALLVCLGPNTGRHKHSEFPNFFVEISMIIYTSQLLICCIEWGKVCEALNIVC